ncbi:ricin-type beta-trefoil lectin domain protein [Streptomyces cocklensis]|uniref:Ricin B lectin domain-containing protein n=1 Tax=Actinacidiphila cocklensis TaxID=887465 RepID=A0A9W4E194_9ACTN|nr:ricin-type beta-trefoil lectin domain protein [Actinacidiphila cocklensis]MDD1058564.1 ricin-type beta-trefoil lectin domain protein [Actinacidiphila cocklensis]CAG6390735.1 hypothetical protein SCOCK_10203 [Actinacidiphila cocklensis]
MWTISPSDAGVPVTPLVGQGGKCLDLASDDNTDGAKVQIYDCNGTGAQTWSYTSSDKALRNPASGKCLDVPAAVTTPGTQLDIYTCNGTTAQQWNLPS